MSSNNGLIGAEAFRKPGVPYYLTDANVGAILRQPTLVSAIDLESADGAASAQLSVVGLEGSPPALSVYSGSIGLRPGTSSLGAAPAGVNIRSLANGVAVEVGTDGAGIVNTLGVAGADGVAQVYDEIYNQPVSQQAITIVASDPDCVPSGVGNIFLCGQTAVAQAGAGVEQFNRFTVPRTGAYAFQTRFVMGNGAGANTVVLPSTLVGGVPIWNMLELVMTEYSTVNVVPFGVTEIIGGDFQAIDTFESNSFTSRAHSTVVFLDSTKEYAIGLVSNSALWNIGTAGQISANLVAMC